MFRPTLSFNQPTLQPSCLADLFIRAFACTVDLVANSYKNLRPLGFTSWGHPQLAAKGSGQPSILLWGKKDPHSDGIADIDLSYDQADEVRGSTLVRTVWGRSRRPCPTPPLVIPFPSLPFPAQTKARLAGKTGMYGTTQHHGKSTERHIFGHWPRNRRGSFVESWCFE